MRRKASERSSASAPRAGAASSLVQKPCSKALFKRKPAGCIGCRLYTIRESRKNFQMHTGDNIHALDDGITRAVHSGCLCRQPGKGRKEGSGATGPGLRERSQGPGEGGKAAGSPDALRQFPILRRDLSLIHISEPTRLGMISY